MVNNQKLKLNQSYISQLNESSTEILKYWPSFEQVPPGVDKRLSYLNQTISICWKNMFLSILFLQNFFWCILDETLAKHWIKTILGTLHLNTKTKNVLTSDSTSRISSPAAGTSFHPTISVGTPGEAFSMVLPFSSSISRTLAQVSPATKIQPFLRLPLWIMEVVTGLRSDGRQIKRKMAFDLIFTINGMF